MVSWLVGGCLPYNLIKRWSSSSTRQRACAHALIRQKLRTFLGSNLQIWMDILVLHPTLPSEATCFRRGQGEISEKRDCWPAPLLESKRKLLQKSPPSRDLQDPQCPPWTINISTPGLNSLFPTIQPENRSVSASELILSSNMLSSEDPEPQFKTFSSLSDEVILIFFSHFYCY